MDTKNIKAIIEQIKEKIAGKLDTVKLTERDRYILMGFAGLLIVVFLYLTVFSFSSKVSKMEKKVLTLQGDLQKLGELKQQYAEDSRALKQLVKNNPQQGPLISNVEKIILSESIERKNFSIRDRNQRSNEDDLYNETSVDVSIKQVPLEKMIDVLYAFQLKYLKVKDLRIRTRFDNSNSVDLSFTVSTFDFKEVV